MSKPEWVDRGGGHDCVPACAPRQTVLECAGRYWPAVADQRGRTVDRSHAEWRKSTYSNLSGCVEVAVVNGQVAIRDSKAQNGPMLTFAAVEWQAFLSGVRAGQFDPPDHS